MKKMLITSLAAVSVAGLIGGGTFAGWTATQTSDADLGAGSLTLTQDVEADQFAQPGGFGRMIPGGTAAFTRVVNIAGGEGRPPGGLESTLSLAIDPTTIVEDDNDCAGDEKLDDSDCDVPSAQDDAELYEQLQIMTLKLKDVDPVTGACVNTGDVVLISQSDNVMLSSLETPYDLNSTVNLGDKVCVAMSAGLPTTVDNSAQTDTVEFDFIWKLTQNV